MMGDLLVDEPIAQPRVEELVGRIRARILSGEWPANSELPPERELAKVLGTNRNTLREALRRLDAANLVVARNRQGVRVLDFRRSGSCELLGPFLREGADPCEKARLLLDLLTPRARLAEVVVELATGRALEEDLTRLHGIVEQAAVAEAAHDAEALVGAQLDWNEALVDATHNMAVRWLANPYLAALRDVLVEQARLVLFDPSFGRHALTVHGAIADRDAHAAIGATRAFHDSADAKLRMALQPIATRVPAR